MRDIGHRPVCLHGVSSLMATVLCLGALPFVYLSSAFHVPSAEPALRFVQMTDPHLFGDDHETNAAALSQAVEMINARIDQGAQYQFVAITGDLAIEDLASAKGTNRTRYPKPDWNAALNKGADQLATLIGACKVKRWLLVAGNNDLVGEEPIKNNHYSEFVSRLGSSVKSYGFEVIDLTPEATKFTSGIWLKQPFAFMGFNNASFKSDNNSTNAAAWKNYHLESISNVLDRLEKTDSSFAYIFYHIPEIDDAHYARSTDSGEVQNWMAKKGREATSLYPFSAWTAYPEVFAKWSEVVRHAKVKGLFSGHFHDWRPDTYEGFRWLQTTNYVLADIAKLYVCPPLAIKFQQNKPSQARGIREVAIDDKGAITTRILWLSQDPGVGRSGLVTEPKVSKAAKLSVVDNLPLVVDPTANSASGWLLLQNTSGVPATNFTLSAGPFTSLTTSQTLGARINLGTSGTPYLVMREMMPGSNFSVKVDVSNFLEGGEAEAAVRANGDVVAMLHAERPGAPFNVTLDGQPAEKPELVLERGADMAFYLRNADAVPYRVKWELEVGGWLVTNGVALVTASSTVRVPFQPKRSFFSWGPCGWMKDKLVDGRLIVRWDEPGNKPMREKPMALRARVKPVGDFLRGIGYFLMLVVLALGAVCSLAMNYGIPNQTKRLDLRDELEVLTKRIHDLTPQIESSMRVLLRVERSRLFDLLKGRWAISPDLANVFKTVSAGITTLKRQLDVLERMDTVYDDMEILRGSMVPPTLLDQVVHKLNQACKLVHASAPPEADLVAAQTLVAEAATWLGNIEKPNEVLALTLAKRVKELRKFFDPAQWGDSTSAEAKKWLKEFRDRLANLFEVIDKTDYETPANITPDLYARLDARTRRLELVEDYLALGKNKMREGERITYEDYFEYLMSALGPEGLAALEHAQRLVRHLQERIFPRQLVEAIKGGHAKIEPDIAFPRTNDAIQFRVVFNNPAFNDATARQSLTCEWDFGDGLSEKGWVVSHYFREARTYEVKTSFFHPDEGPFAGPTKPIKVNPISAGERAKAKGASVAVDEKAAKTKDGAISTEEAPRKRKWQEWLRDKSAPVIERLKLTPRTRIELLRVAIALGAALFALYGTARDQFAQLECLPGLVAVFLVGFGADTIKNLLTQRP